MECKVSWQLKRTGHRVESSLSSKMVRARHHKYETDIPYGSLKFEVEQGKKQGLCSSRVGKRIRNTLFAD